MMPILLNKSSEIEDARKLKVMPEDAIRSEISKSICEAEEELLLAFGLHGAEEDE